jgi:hypothetical protein
MSSEATVKELDLDFSYFTCCGDEDLHPFCCPLCHWSMVFCYECDTLYPDLHHLTEHHRNVNHDHTDQPIFSCPKCDYQFEYFFMKNDAYRVPRSQWLASELGHLLRR